MNSADRWSDVPAGTMDEASLLLFGRAEAFGETSFSVAILEAGRTSIERHLIAAAASVGDSFDTTACLAPGLSPSLSGRVGVKRFQTTPSIWCGMSLAGSSLLFGIDTLALP